MDKANSAGGNLHLDRSVGWTLKGDMEGTVEGLVNVDLHLPVGDRV